LKIREFHLISWEINIFNMRILFKRKKHLIIIHKVYYTFISHVSITQIKEFILDLGKNF